MLSAALLDMMPFGIVVLNVRARILYANAYASEFLDATDGLYAEKGVLRARAVPHQRVLSEILEGFARDEQSMPVGLSIARSNQRPVSIVLSTLPRQKKGTSRSSGSLRIALVLGDPDRQNTPATPLVNDLFQLTPAESQIAILMMECADTALIAQKLEITGNTLRDHLKSIFLKTNSKNQGELLHTLLCSPLGMRFPQKR